MKRIFIYLDDERALPHFWEVRLKQWGIDYMIFRDGQSCFEYLKNRPADTKVFVSFDYDLGTIETGYDLAKCMVANDIKIDGFTVHSMNPVGAKNIAELLVRYGYHKIGFAGEITEL